MPTGSSVSCQIVPCEELTTVLRRQKEYTDLESSVEVSPAMTVTRHYNRTNNFQASAELLTSLGSYLETFQDNLSEVSGQIADLQQRSDEIERQLKGRRVSLSYG